MNKERIDGVVANMKEAGLDYLLISEPSSIDYLIDYVNNPGLIIASAASLAALTNS